MSVAKFSFEDHVKINLHNHKLTQYAFMTVLKTISANFRYIVSLDVSDNPELRDYCVLKLEPFIKSARQLVELNVSNTGISNISISILLKTLPKQCALSNLDVSANCLGSTFFDDLSSLLNHGRLSQLKTLNLTNTGMGDCSAIKIITSILKSSGLEELYLSMNRLKYKTGAAIIFMLSTNVTARLRLIELKGTEINWSMVRTIADILKRRCINIYGKNREEGVYKEISVKEKTRNHKKNTAYKKKCDFHTYQASANTSTIKYTNITTNSNKHTTRNVRQNNKGIESQTSPLKDIEVSKFKSVRNKINSCQSYSPMIPGNYERIKERIRSKKKLASNCHPFYSRRDTVVNNITVQNSKDNSIDSLKETAQFNKLTKSFIQHFGSNRKENLGDYKVNVISNTEKLKAMVAGQIQSLVDFYKQIGNLRQYNQRNTTKTQKVLRKLQTNV